jgi:acyl-ACP thioesterase
MNAIWIESMTIHSYDVGNTGVLKPQVVFQFFQESAGKHATHLGVGYAALQTQGLIWVLSRVKVEIIALPAWGDEVTLVTWPKGVERLFALRDFRLVGRNGEEMVRGTSCWLLVDVERLRPRRIESLNRTFPLNDREHALSESLDKIAVPPGLARKYSRRVMTSDLDVNNHVNNTEYVRWIADCVEGDSGTQQLIRTMQINYLEEAKLADTLEFLAGSPDGTPHTLFVEGVNRASGSTVVQARVELTP